MGLWFSTVWCLCSRAPWRNGRRRGLKILGPKGCPGSSPGGATSRKRWAISPPGVPRHGAGPVRAPRQGERGAPKRLHSTEPREPRARLRSSRSLNGRRGPFGARAHAANEARGSPRDVEREPRSARRGRRMVRGPCPSRSGCGNGGAGDEERHSTAPERQHEEARRASVVCSPAHGSKDTDAARRSRGRAAPTRDSSPTRGRSPISNSAVSGPPRRSPPRVGVFPSRLGGQRVGPRGRIAAPDGQTGPWLEVA